MKWLKRIITNVRWRYRMFCYAEYLVRLHDKMEDLAHQGTYRSSCVPPKKWQQHAGTFRGVPDKELAEGWLSLTVERQREEAKRLDSEMVASAVKAMLSFNKDLKHSWRCMWCNHMNTGKICTRCEKDAQGQKAKRDSTCERVPGLQTTVCDYGCSCLPGLCCNPAREGAGDGDCGKATSPKLGEGVGG